MFTFIVGGPIDPAYAGGALGVMFVTACVFATAFIVNRRSRRELDQAHALATMKERAAEALSIRNADFAHEQKMAALGYRREVDLKQIGEGVVVSHARVENNGEG